MLPSCWVCCAYCRGATTYSFYSLYIHRCLHKNVLHNKQVISPIQLSEVDSVKELCKMRDGVLFSDLSKRDIQILIDVICIS